LTLRSSSGFFLPPPHELYRLFSQFLKRWADLSARHVGGSGQDIAHLPLEQGILFHEPLKGLLVVRSTADYEKHIVELATGQKPDGNFHEQGLFLEMTVLFWHHLVDQLWHQDTRKLLPAILRASVPAEWPDRKPDSDCMALVREFPLEVRLWVGLSPEETEYWRKTRK